MRGKFSMDLLFCQPGNGFPREELTGKPPDVSAQLPFLPRAFTLNKEIREKISGKSEPVLTFPRQYAIICEAGDRGFVWFCLCST